MANHIENEKKPKNENISKIRESIKQIVSQMPPNTSVEEKKEHAKVLIKIFEKEMTPKEALNISDEDVSLFYSYAYQLFNSGKYLEACELFKMLFNLDPRESGFSLGAGVCYHKMQDYEKAIFLYLINSQISPYDPVPLFYCYDCYLHTNNLEGAYLMLYSAIKRAGDEPQYAALRAKADALLDGFDISKIVGLPEAIEELDANGGI